MPLTRTNVIALSVLLLGNIHHDIRHAFNTDKHSYRSSPSSPSSPSSSSHSHSCSAWWAVSAWMPSFSAPHTLRPLRPITLALRVTQHVNSPSTNSNNSNNNSSNNSPSHRKRNVHRKNHNPPSPSSSPIKQRVKAMFQHAKELERAGDYTNASLELRSILELDRYDSHTHLALARIESRRERSLVAYGTADFSPPETGGLPFRGVNATDAHRGDDDGAAFRTDPTGDEAVTTSSLSITQSTNPATLARSAFYNGTVHCPGSVHLWHAWAVHEESTGHIQNARWLFRKVLSLDRCNPYACHALGRLLQRYGDDDNGDGDKGLKK